MAQGREYRRDNTRACLCMSAPTMMVRAPTMAVLAAMQTRAVDTAVAADLPVPATIVAMESAIEDKNMSPTCASTDSLPRWGTSSKSLQPRGAATSCKPD